MKNKTSDKRPAVRYAVIAVVMFIVINRLFYYFNVEAGKWISDTSSYVDYDPHLAYRMFGYPLLIDLFQLLLGKDFAYGVVAVQIILSGLSVFFFYKTAMILSKNNKVLSLIVTVLYGCAPTIMQWDMLIVSESLSISFTVFFIYFAVSWLQDFSRFNAAGMVLSVFFGTITKTALFVFVGAIFLLIVMVYFLKKEQRKELGKKLIFAMGLTVLLGIFDLGYCAYNYRQCGLFSMSYLSSRHKIVHVLRSRTYLDHPDRELVEKIEEIYRNNEYEYGYATTTPILALFGETWPEQNTKALAFAKECLRSHMGEYIRDLCITAFDEVLWKYNSVYETRLPHGKLADILMDIQDFVFDFLRVAYVCFICLVSLVRLIIKWIREKECPFELMGLTGGMLLILITVNLAAYSEWTRLLDYILPFAYADVVLMLGSSIFRLKSDDDRSKVSES